MTVVSHATLRQRSRKASSASRVSRAPSWKRPSMTALKPAAKTAMPMAWGCCERSAISLARVTSFSVRGAAPAPSADE